MTIFAVLLLMLAFITVIGHLIWLALRQAAGLQDVDRAGECDRIQGGVPPLWKGRNFNRAGSSRLTANSLRGAGRIAGGGDRRLAGRNQTAAGPVDACG